MTIIRAFWSILRPYAKERWGEFTAVWLIARIDPTLKISSACPSVSIKKKERELGGGNLFGSSRPAEIRICFFVYVACLLSLSRCLEMRRFQFPPALRTAAATFGIDLCSVPLNDE